MLEFIWYLKSEIPNINIWSYSGYTFEQLMADPVRKQMLREIDVLIDGRFIEAQKDLTLKFKGSKNQRIINVQESLKQNKIILEME